MDKLTDTCFDPSEGSLHMGKREHAHPNFLGLSCGRGVGVGWDRGSRPPLKNHQNIGFPGNTGPDPLKSQSYQASIQCWAIIGMSAKRHLNDG